MRSVAGSGAGGGDRIMGQRLVSTISWRFGGLWKVTEGGLMRRSWVDVSEERMWKPSLRIRESVEAQTISSGEGNVIGVLGGVEGSDGELGIAVFGSGGQDSHRR